MGLPLNLGATPCIDVDLSHGMIDSEQSTDTAQDLLRQMRETTVKTRVLAFRLSLFAEDGVQQFTFLG